MRWLLVLALVACKDDPPAVASKLELVDAPAGDVAAVVAPALAAARAEGKHLLVYVGASWCEPCNRFHAAAAAGQLDGEFGDVRFLVFDKDRDDDALAKAGYTSKLIPLFAIPRDDGTASGKQIEGSIKGDRAIAQIAPRLHELINRP
jgi:hypothetical protein